MLEDSTPPHLENVDIAGDIAVPPIVRCALCGKSDCSEPHSVANAIGRNAVLLAWEGPGQWTARLWTTAIDVSTEPERIFGSLPTGSLPKALGFAVACELLAVGSVAAVLLLIAWAAVPDVVMTTFADLRLWSCLVAIPSGFVLFVVVLHLVAGFTVELGVRSPHTPVNWRLGMRFALYTCGWDLITSPAGILHGLFVDGRSKTWTYLHAALTVPRGALRAYVVTRRQGDPMTERRVLLVSLGILGGVLSIFAIAVFVLVLAIAGVSWPLL